MCWCFTSHLRLTLNTKSLTNALCYTYNAPKYNEQSENSNTEDKLGVQLILATLAPISIFLRKSLSLSHS